MRFGDEIGNEIGSNIDLFVVVFNCFLELWTLLTPPPPPLGYSNTG